MTTYVIVLHEARPESGNVAGDTIGLSPAEAKLLLNPPPTATNASPTPKARLKSIVGS